MKKILLTFFKVIGIIIGLLSLIITAYYYVYLGYIKSSTEVQKKVVFEDVIETVEINEEKFHLFNDLLQKYIAGTKKEEHFLSQKVMEFYSNELGIKYDIEIIVNDKSTFNTMIKNIFPDTIFEKGDKILFNGIKKAKNVFEFNFKISRDKKFILDITFLLNNKGSEIFIKDVKNIDIFIKNKNGLKNFRKNNFTIDYSSLKRIYFHLGEDTVSFIDPYFGMTYYDNFFTILQNTEKFISKNTNTQSSSFYININEKLKPKIIGSIFDNDSTSIGQKQNLNDKLSLLVDALNGTNITINKSLLLISNNNNNFISDFTIKVTKNSNNSTNLTNIKYVDLLKETYIIIDNSDVVVKNFWKENELLKAYLNDTFLSEILLHE